MSLQDFRKDTNSFDPTVTHDDYLYQLLSGLQTTASWPDMAAGHLDHHNLRHHQLPFTGGVDDSPFKPPIIGDANPIENQFHGFTGSLVSNQTQAQNYGTPAVPVTGQVQTASATAGGGAGGGAPSQRRQRVRARRGQATDPHSIAERLRRERIAERLKALQELVPNANSTDKASMLDDIVDYVKFLQLQVKVLSMSRLGGAAGAPIVEEGGGGGAGRTCDELLTSSSTGSATLTEKQVVKLMEENMGSAMQYLQGKGLCLMPISLATTISAATVCHLPGNHPSGCGEAGGPYSPTMSGLTVHSANEFVKESV